MGCLFQDPEDGGLGESLRRQAPANHPQCTLWKLADPQQREVPTLGDPVPRFGPATRWSRGRHSHTLQVLPLGRSPWTRDPGSPVISGCRRARR